MISRDAAASLRKVATAVAAAILFCTTTLPVFACCAVADASFSNTIGYAGELEWDGKIIHVLGYENAPVSLVPGASAGNAMLLPIPAKPNTMSSDNIVDTSKDPTILRQIGEAMPPKPTPLADFFQFLRTLLGQEQLQRERSMGEANAGTPPLVFDHGIYTIVLADNADKIPAALERVPSNKRPALNTEIFSAYQKWYPGWTFALCCFDNKEKGKGAPMLWWYEPQDDTRLFFPALDAHDGTPPKLLSMVEVDHLVAFGSHKTDPISSGQNKVIQYGTRTSAAEKLMADYIVAREYKTYMPQGDFIAKVSDVRLGDSTVTRELPPGARTEQLLMSAVPWVVAVASAAVLYLWLGAIFGAVAWALTTAIWFFPPWVCHVLTSNGSESLALMGFGPFWNSPHPWADSVNWVLLFAETALVLFIISSLAKRRRSASR